ncbi:30S ribosomal protein S17 [candidate division WOR-3 bacterium]|nr:30S ribosomal protein S17 [candidate division WOR-3 bacterium]TET98658.1 MAG: 30S ribosomal protein S17 [Candidatus Stahlbacteria bacterium]
MRWRKKVEIRKKGKVVSDKPDKTIIVEVKRRVQHPLYKKFIVKKKKFYAHDERNEASIGDIVQIVSSRPLSKLKRWRLDKILEKRS